MLVNPAVGAWCWPRPGMHGRESHRSDDVSCHLGHLAGTARNGAAGEKGKRRTVATPGGGSGKKHDV